MSRAASDPRRRLLAGGWPVEPAHAPYVVRLYFAPSPGVGFCGGSLLSNRSVLTAAHCVVGLAPEHLLVGTYQADSPAAPEEARADLVPVAAVAMHPDYRDDDIAAGQDVAVLTLARAPAGYGEDPRPVALDLAASFWARESGAAHAAAYVLGYGAKQYGGPQSLHLRAAHVHPRGAGLCAALLLRPLAPSNLCAGYDGAGACSGDSGGPLVFAHAGEFVQAGVVSWGTGDCTDPGVYSLVAAARAFLAAAAPEARAAAYEPVADPCACSCDSNGFAAATHCDCGVHASHGGEPAEPFCYVRGPECPAARHAAGPASLLGAVTRACDLAPPAPPPLPPPAAETVPLGGTIALALAGVVLAAVGGRVASASRA